MNIALALVPTLIKEGMAFYLNLVRVKAEAAGRTEITLADIESLRLEDPEDIVAAYRRSQGLS